jgi:RNA polymerase sigma-70 factor (ECF subfamily)
MSTNTRSDNRNLRTPIDSYIPVLGEGDGSVIAPESVAALHDEELLRLVTLRSNQALETLYDMSSGTIYSLAVRMLRDAGAAEEVTQDTFFNVWGGASSYRQSRGKVTAWLFSIGHHRIIDEVRRRKRREQTQVYHDGDLINQPSNDTNVPLKFSNRQMQRGMLGEALSALRSEQREIVVLAYSGGLIHSEIANKLGQPLRTVKTRIRLALKKLREVLGPQARKCTEHGL